MFPVRERGPEGREPTENGSDRSAYAIRHVSDYF